MNMIRVLLVLVMWTAAAVAQPTGSAGSAGSATSDGSTAPAPTKTPREICAEAMNADPTFAQSITATVVGKAADTATLQAHADADYHVQKNERHVILAYAAMWVIAAMFVLFLWVRQQALKKEIAILRKDLEAAAK